VDPGGRRSDCLLRRLSSPGGLKSSRL
jgi:hypothetical protein